MCCSRRLSVYCPSPSTFFFFIIIILLSCLKKNVYYYSPWHDVAYTRAIIHCCLQIAQLDFFGIVCIHSSCSVFPLLTFVFSLHNNNSDVHIGNGSLQDQRRESESSNDGVTDSICVCTGIRMPTCLFPPSRSSTSELLDSVHCAQSHQGIRFLMVRLYHL